MKRGRFSDIGDRLKEVRGGLSQGDFAQAIGVAFRTYQRYESGETPPKDDALDRIATYSGKSPAWIMTGREAAVDQAREAGSVYAQDPVEKRIYSLIRVLRAAGMLNETESMLRYLANTAKQKLKASAPAAGSDQAELEDTLNALDQHLEQTGEKEPKESKEKKRA